LDKAYSFIELLLEAERANDLELLASRKPMPNETANDHIAAERESIKSNDISYKQSKCKFANMESHVGWNFDIICMVQKNATWNDNFPSFKGPGEQEKNGGHRKCICFMFTHQQNT